MTTFKSDYKIALKSIDEKQYTKEYESLLKILEIEPLNSQALLSFYKVSIYLKKYKEAKVKFSNYIKHNPKNYKALFFLGVLYKQSLDFEKALIFFNKVKDISIPVGELWKHISECYYHLNQLENTLKILNEAMLIYPKNPDIINKMAYVYEKIGDVNNSYICYIKLSNFPKFQTTACYKMGLLLKKDPNLDKKIIVPPNNSNAHYVLGNLYANNKHLEKSIESFKQVLKFQKNHLQAKMRLYSNKLEICDWSSHVEDRSDFIRVSEKIADSKDLEIDEIDLRFLGFCINYFDTTPDLHLKVAKRCAFEIKQSLKVKPQQIEIINKTSDKRLRIGYLSPDFRDHAVGRLIYDIFRHHNRDKFEIFAYSLLVDKDKIDPVRVEVEKGCDHFLDFTNLSEIEITRRIKKDAIDILVDMGGYTANSSPSVLACKPAPIQLHYLGHPDTMGADFIPYILADKHLLPEEYKIHFSEQPIYLKHGIVASPLPKNLSKIKKVDYNLPEDVFIYSSFNVPKKLNPTVFKVWTDILHETPKSVLWLYAPLQSHKDTFLNFIKSSGIDTDRVIFANNVSYPEYLARFQLADIFLDNFQYGAGSTAANSLMMGCPLLTLSGDNLVSRLGSSVNAAAGMNDWICYSKKEYFDKAVYWANHQQELRDIKYDIKDKIKKSNLCNVEAFVQDLENNFERIILEIKKDF